ncbi:MAG: IS3 family transposase, partial [Stygiobacter sp.]
SFDTLSSEISSYLYRYNYQRRHGSLNYLTPLDCLRNVTELLKSYTVDRSASPVD